MKKIRSSFILLVGFVTLLSCNESGIESQATVYEEILPDTSFHTEENYEATVAPPAIYELTDTNHYVSILNETTYHGDEIPEDVDQQSWIGLYVDKPHYFLEEITVNAERVNDPIVDEDAAAKTGWQITGSHPGESMVLMQGIEVETGEIIHSRLSSHEIMPGDTVTFILEGKSYALFASGNAVDMGGWFSCENYKLFLRGEKNGKTITQLLVAHEDFDDTMIQVIFAGDIDRDHFPDFLLDNARHYNVSLPTLYLSSQAGDLQFVEITGWLESYGC